MNSDRSLSSFRSRFFPVYNSELMGFFLLSACFFFVALQYALLRGCKDTLVLCLKAGGAEAIAASKVFVIVFMILFKIMYDTMCKYVSKYHRLNAVFGYFIFFFLFTLFVLYPNRNNWQLVSLTNKLNSLPGLKSFWPIWLMLRHWPITLIYMHAECVGSFGLGVSLWGIVSYISTVDQSKRIYPLFSLFAGLGTLIAGSIIGDAKKFSIDNIFMICILSFFFLLFIYNWFIKIVKTKPEVYVIGPKPKKKKVRLGLKESFAVLFRSRYFTGITLLVLGYAISIVLFEAVYRDSLKMLVGGNQAAMRMWASRQLMAIGAFQIVCVWIAPYIMRKKWEFGASLVPSIMLVGTVTFFGLFYFGKYLPFASIQHNLPQFVTLVGLGVIVLVKTQKYMTFDTTKESLWLGVSDDEKAIGKSAVDGVGSRFGKGFSALLTTFIIVPYFGSVGHPKAKALLGILIIAIIAIWLWAVKDVGGRFRRRLKGKPGAGSGKALLNKTKK